MGKAALLAYAVDLGSRRVVIFPQEQPFDPCIFLFGNEQFRSVGQDHTKAADLPHMGGVEQITGMYQDDLLPVLLPGGGSYQFLTPCKLQPLVPGRGRHRRQLSPGQPHHPGGQRGDAEGVRLFRIGF